GGAVRWDEAAGGHRARARDGAPGAADGRALRKPRCADAPRDAGAPAVRVGAPPPDRALRYARRGGGAPPRGQRLGDDRPPRPDQEAHQRRAAAAPRARADDVGGVQRPEARGAVADPRGEPAGRGPERWLDGAVLLEPRDLLGRVAELAQDLVGVLAVRGRGPTDRAWRAREHGREPLHLHLAPLGVAHRLRHAEMPDLRVLEHLPDVVDRPRRHARLVQRLDPLGARLLHQDPVELGVQLLAILRAVVDRLEPRVVDQLGRADGGAEPPVHRLARGGDVDVAVGGGEDAGGDAGRVIVPRLGWDLAV